MHTTPEDLFSTCLGKQLMVELIVLNVIQVEHLFGQATCSREHCIVSNTSTKKSIYQYLLCENILLG